MPNRNVSVVMMASTDLAFGRDDDTRLQLTRTEDGTVFLSAIVGNEPSVRLNIRISQAEWKRASKL